MQWGRIVPVVVLALVVTGGLAGCDAEGRVQPRRDTEEKSVACASRIALDTPAERRAAADLVVDAEVDKTGRTVEFQGVYDVYDASVTDVSKGDDPGHTIQVISTSDQCETSGEPVEYLDGDVLAAEGTFRLYLTKADPEDDDSVWRLVVPGAAEPLTTG
ncbi:hypothetical protein [Curtobacterium sp. MCJR17_020]|uniref:hypothetical protein n=1 Tax=Curtobacterium sp. MCJR17_020 TaxID=2175619 RepID=UPI000DA84C57|nr:hypothetical protein [Curtobacterium sp. MCJR17_020]WIE72726.1 hypothetical protein DEJ14_002865 [Curtobacterium sp. MCJR17_020]